MPARIGSNRGGVAAAKHDWLAWAVPASGRVSAAARAAVSVTDVRGRRRTGLSWGRGRSAVEELPDYRELAQVRAGEVRLRGRRRAAKEDLSGQRRLGGADVAPAELDPRRR